LEEKFEDTKEVTRRGNQKR